MGGCRCTYRNCTVRTDGTTHMFHYPVFDKVRCHQWLTNAHKLEFLNLKVSQLKNRVVCQHHFKYEYFMNFKKDKLTFEAIPTLDGPYCDSSQYADKNNSQEVAKMYPISLDDIETEYLTLYDKKANFSVKYGDFLTNCEVMDVEPVNTKKTDMPASTKCQDREQYKDEFSLINLGEDVDKTQNTTINMSNVESTNDVKQIDAQSTLTLPNVYQLINPVVVGIEFDEMPLQLNNEIEKSTANNNNTVQEVAQQTKMVTSENKIEAPKKNKIKILSEKKIANPVTFTGKLEPVSPTQILQWPDRRKNSKTMSSENYSPLIIKTENKPQVNIISSESKPSPVKISSDTTIYPPKTNEITLTSNVTQLNNSFAQTNRRTLKSTVNNEVSPGKSLLKPKINSDRVAAIEKKRKFNMKLRDIVESCLDKIDDSDKEQVKNQINVKNDDRVSTFLSNGRGLPSVQDYTIACLEARMKRMEDVLLNKIDQNTQKIVELKNSLTTTSDKKSNSTQVINNEEFHKKQLYSEISKYLSADVNSLIYEELFINKYVPNTTKSVPSPKKRRRR